MRLLIVFLIIVEICSLAHAQPGGLDRSFGNSGVSIIGVGRREDITQDVLIQPDGKILVAGYSYVVGQDVSLIRLNTDGSLDKAFGQNGKAVYVGHTHSHSQKLTLYDDGKILVATDDQQRPILVRFKSNGILDSTFSVNGRYEDPEQFLAGRFHKAFVLKDNTILAPGSFSVKDNKYDYTLNWIRPNGVRDSSKGINGRITQNILNDEDFASDAIMQSNGKVVMGGSIGTYFIKHFHLVRFNENGTVDSSFGTAGMTLTKVTDTMEWLVKILQLPDNKILASGFYYNGRKQQPAVVRYTFNGVVDSAFGINGIVKIRFDSLDIPAYGCAVDSSNRIIICGSTWDGVASTMFLLRLKPDGEVDSSFGEHGLQKYDIGKQGDLAEAVAVQHDGNYIVAGETYINDTLDYDFAVLRVLPENILSVKNDKKISNTLSIYPNPILEHATILFTDFNQSAIHVNITNMLGIVVFSHEYLLEENQMQINLDLSHLINGCYTCTIMTPEGRIGKRFIKE
jgi:uncharacterized delta-60 repeat protein